MKKILYLFALLSGFIHMNHASANQSVPRDVVCNVSYIFPEDVYTIIVKNACPGVTYSLCKWGQPLKTATGTGVDLAFTGAFGTGNFSVSDASGLEMKNTILISDYWPLNYNFQSPSRFPAPPIDKNGGVVEMTLHTTYGPGLDAMNALFDRYNAGDRNWDNHAMRIVAESREIINNGLNYIFHIKVYCAPNISSALISNDTGMKYTGDPSYGKLYQQGGGELVNWTMDLGSYGTFGQGLRLTGTQPLVTYELYNNDQLIASKMQQTNQDIYFSDLEPGLYTVKAAYTNKAGLTVSRQHEQEIAYRLDELIKEIPLITFNDAHIIWLDKKGGNRTLTCTRNKYVTDARIDQVIREFNAESAHIKMRLIGTGETSCGIELTWGANFSGGEIEIDSKFLFNGNNRVMIKQPDNGDILAYNVTCSPSSIGITLGAIQLSGSQIGVTYEVYKDGKPTGQSKEGTGVRLSFGALPVDHVYTVYGKNLVWNRVQKMNGAAALMLNPEDKFTYATTVVSEKTYYDNTCFSTDITYYDGLGARYQTVHYNASPSGKNIITPILYDDMYRSDAKVLLPFVGDHPTGERVDSLERDQQLYYAKRTDGDRDNSAYADNVYDKSGLNRILYGYKPGEIYRQENKYTEYLYGANISTEDKVFDFTYNYDNASIRAAGYYATGKLYKNTVIDEDGNKAEQFTDASGNTVLERRHTDFGEQADTYYIYDPFYRYLRWVLSPEASRQLITGRTINWVDNLANQYCYRYQYDGRGNVIERQIPGRDKELFVYDKSNRLVFSQDGNLYSREQWLYYVYDNHGNLLRQNLIALAPGTSQDDYWQLLQGLYDMVSDNRLPELGGTTDMDLPFNTEIGTVIRKLVYNIYGNIQHTYSPSVGFVETPWSVPADLAFVANASFPELCLSNPVSLKTYERLAVLGEGTPEELGYVERTYYYDYKNRPIQIVERNQHDGISRMCYKYDTQGNMLKSEETRQPAADTREDILTLECGYDNRRRLVSETWSLNNSEPVVIQYRYNDLGQLVGMNQNDILTTSLKYNIQGWQTEQNVMKGADSVFYSQLRYYNPRQQHSIPCYTGNISEWEWKHGNDIVGQSKVKHSQYTYAFWYDKLNRLRQSELFADGIHTDEFVEFPKDPNVSGNRHSNYDLNGNIYRMIRTSQGRVKDKFSYDYTGNQLMAIVDSTYTHRYTYAYDANGNMTKDGLNRLDFTYNPLNSIEKVEQDGTTMVKYTYLADGTKIAASTTNGDGLMYAGSLIYLNISAEEYWLMDAGFSGGRLFSFLNDEVTPLYHVTDHLGSVRAIAIAENGVIERSNYYPFGKRWEESDLPLFDFNFYRYNGKEGQGLFGIPYIDYGARMYNPDLGRWFNPDPLAEKFNRFTPYGFCLNNPIRLVDSDGRQPQDPQKKVTPMSSPKFQKAENYAKTAAENGKGAVSASMSLEAAYRKVGAKFQAGPVSGEGSLKLGSFSFEASTDNASVTGKVFSASVKATVGEESVETSANLVTGKVVVENGSVKADVSLGSVNTEVKSGKGFVSIDNNSTVGAGAQIGPVKVEASVNLNKAKNSFVAAAAAIGTLIMPEEKRVERIEPK